MAFAINFASASSAEEARTGILSRSNLFETLAVDGIWDVDVSDTGIEYNCLDCGGDLIARLAVVAPYEAHGFSTVKERYLAERRQRCFELTANRLGRCVGTRRTAVRPSLHGFQSETELETIRQIEIVFFYNDRYWPGPELLRTTIEISEGAALPENSVRMFMSHMARLTLFW